MNTYVFRLLDVDLSNGKTSIHTIDSETVRRFIGGTGLAAWLLWKEGPESPDPLDPTAQLIFVTGPLTGTPVTSSGRHGVAGRSPLTGFWGEANVGGTWGSVLRKAGVDGIRVSGKAKGPVYLWITEDRIEIRDASHIWGADTFDTQAIIQAETHPKAVVSCVGPAGEKGVRIACVMTDGAHGRAAGRCGLGAVMGSKNLKAMAVFGKGKIPIARKQDLLKDIEGRVKSFREKSMPLHKAGTPGLVIPQEESGSFPIKNYAQDRWPEGAQRTSWPTMEETLFIKNYRCDGCILGCGRTVGMEASNDPNLGLTGGPEYETLALLGANLLIDDIRTVQRMNEVCNRLGMDVIEAGSLLGFAMEAFEKDLLPPDLLEGLEPRWGDGEGALQLIGQMGEGRGLGGFLGQGYSRVLDELPPEARDIAMHVKGLGFPAHDPRAYNSVALGYATSNRGACHLQGFTHVFERVVTEPALGLDEVGDRFGTDKGKVVADLQNLMALYDSLTICKFNLFGGVKVPDLAKWFEMVTGLQMDHQELLLAGERIYNIKRLLNLRWGVTPDMDSLPKRMLTQAKKEGASKGHLPPLDRLLEQYYHARGWDNSGGASPKKREQLGI
jgi:aldehyde:ferredoxin oxidoreductase